MTARKFQKQGKLSVTKDSLTTVGAKKVNSPFQENTLQKQNNTIQE